MRGRQGDIASTSVRVAVTRVSTSARLRPGVHGQRPIDAPARLMTAPAPASSSVQLPGLRGIPGDRPDPGHRVVGSVGYA